MIRIVFACIASLCLSGCAALSPQIQHLQLSSGSVAAGTRDQPVIILDTIALPDYLLRDELLRRDSDYLLHYDSLRRWAEPLDLGIQRVLSQRLQDALDTRQVISFPRVSPAPAQWVLHVSFTHFEAQDDRVTLSAEGRWEAADNTGTTVTTVVFEDSVPLDAGNPENIVRSMSELLWRFAEELAAPLQTTNQKPNP